MKTRLFTSKQKKQPLLTFLRELKLSKVNRLSAMPYFALGFIASSHAHIVAFYRKGLRGSISYAPTVAHPFCAPSASSIVTLLTTLLSASSVVAPSPYLKSTNLSLPHLFQARWADFLHIGSRAQRLFILSNKRLRDCKWRADMTASCCHDTRLPGVIEPTTCERQLHCAGLPRTETSSANEHSKRRSHSLPGCPPVTLRR